MNAPQVTDAAERRQKGNHAMVWSLLILVLALADQGIKVVVRSRIGPNDSIPVIDGFFFLIRRENRGGAWSLLAGQDWGIYLLSAVSMILSIILFYLILKARKTVVRATLAVIVGGSVGNLIDRLRLGAVTDYIDLHFGSYIFPTFNLADSLVVCGTIILCVLLFTDPHLLNNRKPDART